MLTNLTTYDKKDESLRNRTYQTDKKGHRKSVALCLAEKFKI